MPRGLPKPGRAARPQPDAPAAAPPDSTVLPFLTVAIGASAGGLDAFTQFLTALPPATGMAFVLIQHLDPAHKSLLVGLLSSHTTMTVVEAVDGMRLVPDTAFVIPPNATMTISGGRLAVASPAPARATRHPIDSCFMSLAADQRQHAVAIVLAGAGGDGSRGLAPIKQHGGLTLAQAGDQGRALDGMPQSAVASGHVDQVLPVGAMPAALVAWRAALRAGHTPPGVATAADLEAERFSQVCALLRDRTGHDFSDYKRPTLLRRIHRRMRALHIATTDEYLALLRARPEQIDRLLQDLLIGVTRFMRDEAAFEALQETVLPKLLAGKGAADTVRIWVPGCASGEEVYSLAILLRELMDREKVWPKVQIFGTDIDDTAITAARAGSYVARSLAHVLPERRDRWFVEESGAFRPVRSIRDMCVFSLHSVTKDPPFSRLDMISCRNVLIYLGGDLQAQVLRSFHYALNTGGILFLGPSESVTQAAGLFTQLDRRHRIFQRRTLTTMRSGILQAGVALAQRVPAMTVALPLTPGGDAVEQIIRRTLEPFSPAYVVVDQSYNIVRFSGGEIGRFLEPSAGAASLNLFGIIRKVLRPAVRSAVRKATAANGTIIEENLTLPIDGRSRLITLIVAPIAASHTEQQSLVVAFQIAGAARSRTRQAALPGAGDTGDAAHEMVEELSATRTQLLMTIGELETLNEEMKSSNEEYQSTNEELQATNEELETAKEEMQSVNEELQTVNDELATKNEQLSKLNNDFQNLLNGTQIATLFLDKDMNVTRFTPRVTALFRLRDSDLGRPIHEITSRLAYETLAADVTAVLGGREIVERQVHPSQGGATFLMQMRPYRTVDNRIEGVVITFVDVSEQNRLHTADTLRAANQTLERRMAERTAELKATGQALTRQTEERHRAEEMLRQSQKLEAVGKLTGGIAHDFNNLLGVIIGNAEFLLDSVREHPEQAEQVREILDTALSGAELTRRLLAFARRQPLQPRRIDLNQLLPSQVAMLRRMLGETIEVAATLAPDLWPTSADPSQIGDALINLALNARDAMPHGGHLTVETSNMHLDAADAARHVEAAAGDYVVLAVTDTGLGMPPEVVERATEPFFSTKSPAAGSGLGLSMIYGFARQSGGYLTIDSTVGVGTTVRLHLLRARNDELAGPEEPEEIVGLGGNESILLVDDNLTLREVTRRHLMALGYQVGVADNGPAALTLLRSGTRFDLLLTDVVMPHGLNGYQLAEAARLMQPDLKALFTTGYAGDAATNVENALAAGPMLRKPYRRNELAERVRAVLDAAEVET